MNAPHWLDLYHWFKATVGCPTGSMVAVHSPLLHRGGSTALHETEEEQEPQVKPRWGMSLSTLILVISNTAFLAFTAGLVSERLKGVNEKLDAHIAVDDNTILRTRIATLEAERVADKDSQRQFRDEVLNQLNKLSDQIQDLARGQK